MTNYKKSFKRGIRKASSAVKQRYFKGKGFKNPQLQTMGKDIMYLKSVLNPEKKTFQITNTLIPVGQTIGNSNGFYAFDCTPLPAQGTTSVTRNGNSIKLHSSYLRFQVSQQAAVTNPIRIRIRMDLVKGTPQAVGTWPSTVLEANPFISGGTIYDYNSNNNADYFGTYKTIFQRQYLIKQDSISGGNSITDIKIPLKYFRGKGHHVRFAADGSVSVSDGQLIVFITADNGNASAAVPVTTLFGVPIGASAVSTGVTVSWNIIHYFFDN